MSACSCAPSQVVDPKTGAETQVVVSEDDGIRPDVTTETLRGLRAVFKKDGTTTAGNSSQVRACSGSRRSTLTYTCLAVCPFVWVRVCLCVCARTGHHA